MGAIIMERLRREETRVNAFDLEMHVFLRRHAADHGGDSVSLTIGQLRPLLTMDHPFHDRLVCDAASLQP